MNRFKRIRLAGVIVCTLAFLLMTTGIANAASWSIVASPNRLDSPTNVLNSVATVSPTSVWAVGSFFNSNSGTDQTLIEHWNGSTWSIVLSPLAPGSSDNYLTGIKVISTNDIWAVGYSNNIDRTISQTLTEHWNGHSWSVISSPNRFTGNNKLMGVSATSSSDVWAVGTFFNPNSGTIQTLTEHWNGSNWSIIPSPVAPSSSDNILSAVRAISSKNVWAVGYAYAMSGKPARTLIEHWNGSTWQVIGSPNKGTDNNLLQSVSSVSATDMWAVGFYVTSSGGVSVARTLTEHWNGSAWMVITSPNTSSSINHLRGVIAISSTNVWAVGFSLTGENPRQTLIEHWNGSRWSTVSSPNTGTGDNVLNAVTKVPGTTQAWAVGSYNQTRFGGPQLTLVEHYA